MKHYSPSDLDRAVDRSADLRSNDDLLAGMRAQLDGTARAKTALAGRLGISEGQLSYILRNDRGVGDQVAEKLGYRKVIRFEKIS